MQSKDGSSHPAEDLLYEHTRWLKPSCELKVPVMQSPGPWIIADRWEVFRKLPKPVSWSEAEILAKEPQEPVQWEGVQAKAVLDFSELVSRSYIPDFQDGPQPLNVWNKRHNLAEPVSAPAYAYTALGAEDEVRVLDIHPGQGTDPLAFSLRSTRLDDSRTNYEALSYAWGWMMVEIVHEERSISMPQNLYRALLSLRDPTRPRSVWADALCINQNDEQEKSRQVRMMGRIFKQARQVLIYLDEGDAHVAPMAFDLARRIRQGQLESVPPPDSPMWGVLVRLFDKAWFGRLWCLQEVVLASSAQVIWGSETAPWEDVGFSAAWLCNIGYEVLSRWIGRVLRSRNGSTCSGYSYHPGIYRASLMYSLRSAIRTVPAEPVTFYELLCLTRPFESTDPRDKVFALTGIPTVEADPTVGQCFFEPDYSKTTLQVFVEVAKRIMAQTPGHLHLLGGVQHDRGSLDYPWDKPKSGLPTWVPNWEVFSSRSLVPATSPSEERPSASSRLPHAKMSFDGSALLLSGIQIDTVKKTAMFFSREHISSMVMPVSEAWEEMVEQIGTYPGSTSLPEAFCWTITAGNNWHGQRVGSSERARHIADYEAFRKQYCLDTYFPALEIPEGTVQTGDARRFYEAFCHACSNRTFFVTEKGYMGIGPGSMGCDSVQVFVLAGTELPFVLMERHPHPHDSRLRSTNSASDVVEHVRDCSARSDSAPATGEDEEGQYVSKRSFSVLGECYVHGIMSGEIGMDGSLHVEALRLV